MHKIFYYLFLILFCIFTDKSFANSLRSNHSYKNLGFTQLPIVSVGGSIEANGFMPKQEALYSDDVLNNVLGYDDTGLTIFNNIKNRATDNLGFAVEGNLLFKINGVNDYGFKYGAVIELSSNTTYNSWNNDLNATKSFIYGESLFGKIEFGNEIGASQKMKVDAGTFARGAGGINGKYLNYINLPSISTNGTLTNTPAFILIPELPSAHGGFGVGYNNLLYICDYNGDNNISGANELECYAENSNENFTLLLENMQNATKISYYTPKIFGLQIGLSYTPDTGNKGVSGRLSSRLDTGDIDDVLEYGISYNQTFYNLNISLAFTGQTGKSESKILNNENYKTFREKLNANAYGVNLSFLGLTFGGSMGNWDNSLYNIDMDLNKGKGQYYTAGVAYEFYGVNGSFGYFKSEFQNNVYSAFSLDIEYKVAEGFLPYIGYTHFEFLPDDINIVANKGDVFLVGFIVNF